MKLSTWAGSKIASAPNGGSIATTHTLPRQTSTTMVTWVPCRPVTTSVRRVITECSPRRCFDGTQDLGEQPDEVRSERDYRVEVASAVADSDLGANRQPHHVVSPVVPALGPWKITEKRMLSIRMPDCGYAYPLAG